MLFRDPRIATNVIKKCQEDIAQLKLRTAALESSRPHPRPDFPKPKLHLKVLDLDHAGAQVFFANVNPTIALSRAVEVVLSLLYEPSLANKHIPPTRSITLVLRSMAGVAYTTGSDIDDDHKEIYFSLDYIKRVTEQPPKPGQPAAELQGVLVHEMVHCWQWNGLGTAPGGLIEGIADFVRLKAGFVPAHWKKEAGKKWDVGYQRTGYFLDWIENKFGNGSVRKVNEALRAEKYDEERFWDKLFQSRVTILWEEYSRSLKDEENV